MSREATTSATGRRQKLDQLEKAPIEVVVDRPSLSQRRAVIQVPNSTYRILYIDPEQRQEVVARHGFVAIRTDGLKVHDSNAQSRKSSKANSDALWNQKSEEVSRRASGDDRFGDVDMPKKRGSHHSSSKRSSRASSSRVQSEHDEENDPDNPWAGFGTMTKERHANNILDEEDALDVDSEGGQSDSEEGHAKTEKRDPRKQQYIMPKGKMVQGAVYFEDIKFAEDYVNLKPENEEQYDREEIEICEMAGVDRIGAREYEPTEADLSYEIPSKVLDALRLAIAAPMADFRPQAMGDEADVLDHFRKRALEELALTKDPFADEEVQIMAAPVINYQMTSEEMDQKAKIKRRKALHKQVNDWKKTYEERYGEKPSARDMHGDEEFGPLYREYVQLKKETAAFDKNMKKKDEAALPGARTDEDPFAAAENPELIATSNDTKAAAESRTPAPQSLQPMALAPMATPQPIGDSKTPAPQSQADAIYQSLPKEQRMNVKLMIRNVRAWKKEYFNINGEEPTRAVMVTDMTISRDYMELRRILKDDDANISDDENVSVEAQLKAIQEAMVATEEEETRDRREMTKSEEKEWRKLWAERPPEKELTVLEAVARRKELGRQLNQWKADFKESNDRAPTAKDISRDEVIAPVYEEYSRLPKYSNEQIAAAEAEAGGKPTTPQLGEASPQLDPAAQARRRKQLGKELNAWKAKFKEETGREPTSVDIEEDQEIAAIFHEYRTLPKGDSASVSENPTEDGSSTNIGDPIEAGKRRKHLGKLLNAWKQKFREEHSRDPTQSDLEGDPEIAAIYHEYKNLPKDVDLPRAPSQNSENESEEKSQHRRRKQLTRELNAWKQKFKDEHDREPTESDITADPEMKVIFEEYQSLPHHGRRKSLSVMERSSRSASTDPQKRRKHLGKELNHWRTKFQEENGRKPTQEDINADEHIKAVFDEYQSIPKEMEQSAVEPTTAPTATDPQARRKTLGKMLNTWKIKFSEDNGRKPTQEDIDADPEMKAVFDEYMSIPKDGDSTAPAPAPTVTAPADQSDPQLRRKELGKMLNNWKTQFLEDHGRKPTQEDINADASMKAVYDEYASIPKEAGATPAQSNSGGGANDDQARRKELGKLLNNWKIKFSEEQGRKPTQEDINADAEMKPIFDEYMSIPKDTNSSSEPGAGPSAPPETSPSATDPQVRRKELGRLLNNWKIEFQEQNGRKPKQEDINADSEMKAIFDEYQSIPKDANGASEAGHPPSTPPATVPQVDEAMDDAKSIKKRRKQLGKELNAWKAQFAESNGRAPTAKDIMEDATIKDIYEEYIALPKEDKKDDAESGTGNAEDDTQAADTTADDAVADEAAALAARKKFLVKQLQAWKEAYSEEHGVAPKATDILADPDIEPIYTEYLQLKKAI